jgi:hypothetical protein
MQDFLMSNKQGIEDHYSDPVVHIVKLQNVLGNLNKLDQCIVDRGGTYIEPVEIVGQRSDRVIAQSRI